MYTYFEQSSLTGVLLYNNNRHIFARTRSGDQFSRPVLLSNDHESDLSGTLYENTIYYAYISNTGSILIKNILSLQTLYTIHPKEEHHYKKIVLTTIAGHLFLLYLDEAINDHSHRIEYILPFQSDRKLPGVDHLPTYSSEPDFWIANNHKYGLLMIHYAQSNTCDLITSDLDVIELQDAASIQKQAELFAAEKYALYTSTYELNHAQKQTAMQKELDAHKEEISRLKQEIIRQQAIIQSASNQYDELMKVANTYKTEAIKWHSKYHKNI